MKKEILENHRMYLERIKFYKSFGYDADKERKFILDVAMPVFGNVLEVGTGKGYFALLLAREGFIFSSVDISEEEQKFARLNLKYFGLEKFADLRIENAECMSFDDKSFDVIFSINTFHHLENPFKVTDEMIRLVTFEGKIVISDFTKKGLDIIDRMHKSESRIHHVGVADLNKIKEYLAGKGFTTQKEESKYQQVLIAYHQIK